MYYSEHLKTLTKQEKNPVNKMYLSELNMKWKHFQELVGIPETTNEQLAEALSIYLATVHNKKFTYNKMRGTGFHHNSPVFSSYYIHDLISALICKDPIVTQTGMEWGFSPFSYNFMLTGKDPQSNSETPEFHFQQTPKVLSLSQSLDLQYRITGKRNFTKTQINIPYLLFFAFKHPKADHFFMVEHYTKIALRTSRFVKTFMVCENVTDYKSYLNEDLPISLYALHTRTRNGNEISKETISKLEENIQLALKPVGDQVLFKEKRTSQPRVQKPRRKPSKPRSRNR